jgi:Calcineurin-like phosphoesterase
VLAYLTDVEGVWSKVASFATGAAAQRLGVVLDSAGRLVVSEGTVFVFGGDAIDRGPHGRRVVATLLDAKRRQPDRVVLLAGNRDINKLRLLRELGGHPPQLTPPDLTASDARPALLRFLFEKTMGARDAFEHRRTELAEEGLPANDEDVVDSYVADLSPGGDLRAYLGLCQLAYRAGETLFVHGGVGDESLGFVPTRPRDDLERDVGKWVGKLNEFYAEQMGAFEEGRLDSTGTPSWAPLVAYQAPLPGGRTNPASVVYGRLADEHNNLQLPSEATIHALAGAGIERVVVGHTPSGDTPSIRRQVTRARRFELVVADNSHARVDTATQLGIDGSRLTATGRTKLDDGTLHEVVLDLDLSDEATPIGRTTPDDKLVKGVLPDGRLLLYKALPHWVTEQIAVLPGSVDIEPARLR